MVFLGTSGWAYKAWRPSFYPEKLAEKNFLHHYATRLNAVEVNYTFRRTVAEKTLESWIAATPATFRFCIKAHQSITHLRRLRDCQEAVRRFFDSIAPLASAGRLGPVLFQLPPNLRADASILDDFLGSLPRAHAAFEFRDRSWFSEPVLDVLRKHGASLCLAETDEMSAPDVMTAAFSYYRLRKSDYPEAARAAVAERLTVAAASGRETYGFFKHEERPESPLWAEDVLRRIAENQQLRAA